MDISVIIPVYNVEKYLRRCLNSVLRQEGITTEIILVDDGSTDSSGCICDEYFTQHTNIKCLHVENGGPATAKNIGYNFATGRYIAFSPTSLKVALLFLIVPYATGTQS